jgi:hypothetical protein
VKAYVCKYAKVNTAANMNQKQILYLYYAMFCILGFVRLEAFAANKCTKICELSFNSISTWLIATKDFITSLAWAYGS